MLKKISIISFIIFMCASCSTETMTKKVSSNKNVINIKDASYLVRDGEYACHYDLYVNGASLLVNNAQIESTPAARLLVKRVSDAEAQAILYLDNGGSVKGSKLMLQIPEQGLTVYEQQPNLSSSSSDPGMKIVYATTNSGELEEITVTFSNLINPVDGMAKCSPQ